MSLLWGVRTPIARADGLGSSRMHVWPQPLGIEAQWAPMALDQRVGWALTTSILWTYIAVDGRSASDEAALIELTFGGRLRLAPGTAPGRFVAIGGGATLTRSNTPLPPDAQRQAAGGYLEMGYEHTLARVLVLSGQARVGTLGSGPTLLTGIAGVGLSW